MSKIKKQKVEIVDKAIQEMGLDLKMKSEPSVMREMIRVVD